MLQAVYLSPIELHQTPDWSDRPYNIHRDPLWKTEKQGKEFDDVWFYHCDHLGTPQEMTDHTGAIIWKAEYRAWGECKTEKAKSNFFENSEIISNNIRFQGQYFDEETGLHYNRYRYYSPYVGRFVSKDPIGLLGGNNVYAYVASSTAWIDPLGLATECEKRQLIYNAKLMEIKNYIAEHDYTKRSNVNLKISGGVSGAIGYTKATGILVGNSDHVIKGQSILSGLKRTMKSVDKAYSLCEKDKAKLHAYADPYIRRLQGALAMPTKIQKTGAST
ncbi:hypothetical protein AC058_01110 [Acinetobacter genomosp. 33YU]|uniref:RHS protein conserved region domain-containing protein n=1 Tax=Acinetobacter genomosp. 33YU TaxID=1675530 RepID=A0A1V2V3K9_9GAMM|nr:hypothetical protein AC058_01110 [Acinetobacter genomosp. 33YU]